MSKYTPLPHLIKSKVVQNLLLTVNIYESNKDAAKKRTSEAVGVVV